VSSHTAQGMLVAYGGTPSSSLTLPSLDFRVREGCDSEPWSVRTSLARSAASLLIGPPWPSFINQPTPKRVGLLPAGALLCAGLPHWPCIHPISCWQVSGNKCRSRGPALCWFMQRRNSVVIVPAGSQPTAAGLKPEPEASRGSMWPGLNLVGTPGTLTAARTEKPSGRDFALISSF